MTAKTVAERQAAFRLARKDRPEVRGIFAHPDDHLKIKNYANSVIGLRIMRKPKVKE